MSVTRKIFWKAVVLAALVGVAAFFAKTKKDMLVREGANFLQALLSRESNLDVKIGKISGKLSGAIRFDDVRLEDPRLPTGLKVLFRADRVEFRYRPWEFFTKNFTSKITVNVKNPEIYWLPAIRLHYDPFPFFNWLRDLLLTQRQRFDLHVTNLTLVAGVDRRRFDGISLDYADDRFQIEMPAHHVDFFGNDLSTDIHLSGHFEWALSRDDDTLVGQISTEGSVVDWQPLAWESQADFTLTRTSLHVDSSKFLGGFELTGALNFSDIGFADFILRTEGYQLKNFEPFIGRGQTGSYDGTLDLEAHFQGPPDALSTDAHATLRGGKSGNGHYRALVLHANGVYPTFTLSNSQLIAEDGVIMRLADETIEFKDLFNPSTYRSLVTGVSQDEVSMGDWGFRRTMDENQLPEFLMQRSLNNRARVQLRKYNEPEDRKILQPATEDERRDMEVGFTYRLRGNDTVKYTVREDEQFVGVERKMSF